MRKIALVLLAAVWFAETAEKAWEDILYWYEASGHPLFPPQPEII